MFNIYTHEKRVKEEKAELNKQRKEDLIELNRKSKLNVILFRETSEFVPFLRKKDKKIYL